MSALQEVMERYEVVIGLEVHSQLRTDSKLFCGCAVRYGDPPNHHTCPVCLALPGALPVLNERAVSLGVRAALATHCSVQPQSIFARKNYFYPDLPKGYQISQFEEPLSTGGWLEIPMPDEATADAVRRIGITRIHMEEDAGKSIHDDSEAGGDGSQVDLNRAGVPLLEIVSEPDLRSPEEAGAYLRTLRQILRYIEVSDADMEKGHFRCDANVSLRLHGALDLGTRTELKNLNSFRFVEAAIAAEIERQAEVLDGGGAIQQATLLWDRTSGQTRVMRLKENSDDYRYFPEPDLIPVNIDPQAVQAIRAELPELPDQKRERFVREHGLSEYDAGLLTGSRSLADFFEASTAAYGKAKPIANWLLRDVLRALNEREAEIDEVALVPETLVALLRMVDAGRVTPKSARELIPELVARGGDVEALVRERGVEAVSDAGILETAVAEVLAENAQAVERFRSGEEKMLNFLMGQVMRRTSGKASPAAVRDILAAKLGG